MRTLAVGDIHGCYRSLITLESFAKFKPDDRIVTLGDYVDRGPDSKSVIEWLIDHESNGHLIALRGNHELMMLNAMEDLGYGMNPIELWYYNGGEATVQSFGSSSFFSFLADLDPGYLAFFRSLQMSEVIGLGAPGEILVSHAGITPFIPLADQLAMDGYKSLTNYLTKNHIDPGDSFLWVRDAFFNCSPELWKGYLVVHGHTPVLKLKCNYVAKGQNEFHFVPVGPSDCRHFQQRAEYFPW